MAKFHYQRPNHHIVKFLVFPEFPIIMNRWPYSLNMVSA